MTAAMGLALLAGASACGGDGTRPPAEVSAVDATTTTAADPGAAFAACLRDNGVDPADRARIADGGAPPSSRPDGTPPSSRPDGSPPPSRAGGARPSTSFPPGSRPSTSLPAGVDQAKLAAAREACRSLQPTDRPTPTGLPSQAFQVYASCMKDHGVTVTPGPGLNRDDAAFKAGDAICGVLRSSS